MDVPIVSIYLGALIWKKIQYILAKKEIISFFIDHISN